MTMESIRAVIDDAGGLSVSGDPATATSALGPHEEEVGRSIHAFGPTQLVSEDRPIEKSDAHPGLARDRGRHQQSPLDFNQIDISIDVRHDSADAANEQPRAVDGTDVYPHTCGKTGKYMRLSVDNAGDLPYNIREVDVRLYNSEPTPQVALASAVAAATADPYDTDAFWWLANCPASEYHHAEGSNPPLSRCMPFCTCRHTLSWRWWLHL